jgi:hypothetical protein
MTSVWAEQAPSAVLVWAAWDRLMTRAFFAPVVSSFAAVDLVAERAAYRQEVVAQAVSWTARRTATVRMLEVH